MNHIPNLLRIAIVAILAQLAFGSPAQTQAAPSSAEPDQFSCADVTEIPQIECEALVAIYNLNPQSSFDNWLETTTPCSWSYIACENNQVTRLYFDIIELRNLPPEIGNLTNLTELDIYSNQLSNLPTELGNLTNLTGLYLPDNQLRSLPAEIGNLTNLTDLYLAGNQLSSLPTEITNLKMLRDFFVFYNRLDIPEGALRSFVTEHDPAWSMTQTVAPTDVVATILSENVIELAWTPIEFQDEGGYYEISVTDGDSFTIYGTTTSKSIGNYLIDGLANGTTYGIRIRTYTPANENMFDILFDDHRSEFWSEYSETISATPLEQPTPTPTPHTIYIPIVQK